MRQHELTGAMPGLAPREQELPLFRKLVNAGVAITICDIHVAVRQNRDVRDAMKRSRCAQHGTFVDFVSRVGCLAGLTERHEPFAVDGELVDRVILVVGEPEMILMVDENAVRVLEDTLAPCIEEFAFLVEHDDGIVTAIEHVHPVL